MITREEEKRLVEVEMRNIPEVFGLRKFPNELFRVSPDSSYFSDHENRVLLYTQRLVDGQWLDFAKGTREQLLQNLVVLKTSDIYR